MLSIKPHCAAGGRGRELRPWAAGGGGGAALRMGAAGSGAGGRQAVAKEGVRNADWLVRRNKLPGHIPLGCNNVCVDFETLGKNVVESKT